MTKIETWDMRNNRLLVHSIEPEVQPEITTTSAVTDGEATVVAAGRTLTQALQDIVDWADAEFARDET